MTHRLALAILLVCLATGSRPDVAQGILQQSTASQDEALATQAIDELLAPIALYPDALLRQVLMCSESPFQTRALGEWLAANPDIQGSAIQDGAEAEGFDPSYVALSAFPQVVQMMAQDLEWTTELGEAFMNDRSAVLESVQRLRAQAQAVGNLQTTSQHKVSTQTTDTGQQAIVIEPANPEIIYVPHYDPVVVYTTPPPQTTVVVEEDDGDDEAAAALVGFAAGVFVGAAVNSYYGPYYGWYGPVYWYNDPWDDWYDHREDMWDKREERREELEPGREERQADRDERRADRQEGSANERRADRQEGTAGERRAARQEGGSSERQAATARERGSGAARTGGASSDLANYRSRGFSMGGTQTKPQRSGTRSSAFSGYGNRSASRAAASRGRTSMGRRGGGRRR